MTRLNYCDWCGGTFVESREYPFCGESCAEEYERDAAERTARAEAEAAERAAIIFGIDGDEP